LRLAGQDRANSCNRIGHQNQGDQQPGMNSNFCVGLVLMISPTV
jgi:hypothetical protein